MIVATLVLLLSNPDPVLAGKSKTKPKNTNGSTQASYRHLSPDDHQSYARQVRNLTADNGRLHVTINGLEAELSTVKDAMIKHGFTGSWTKRFENFVTEYERCSDLAKKYETDLSKLNDKLKTSQNELRDVKQENQKLNGYKAKADGMDAMTHRLKNYENELRRLRAENSSLQLDKPKIKKVEPKPVELTLPTRVEVFTKNDGWVDAVVTHYKVRYTETVNRWFCRGTKQKTRTKHFEPESEHLRPYTENSE